MIKYEWIYKSVCNRKPSVFPKRTVNLNFINMSIRSINDFQMVAHTAQSNDFYIGVNACQLLTQKAHIDLYMVFYGVGVVAPDSGENGLLGEITFSCLHETAHDIELTRGQTDAVFSADEHRRTQIQSGVAIGDHIYLIALTAQERIDAG